MSSSHPTLPINHVTRLIAHAHRTTAALTPLREAHPFTTLSSQLTAIASHCTAITASLELVHAALLRDAADDAADDALTSRLRAVLDACGDAFACVEADVGKLGAAPAAGGAAGGDGRLRRRLKRKGSGRGEEEVMGAVVGQLGGLRRRVEGVLGVLLGVGGEGEVDALAAGTKGVKVPEAVVDGVAGEEEVAEMWEFDFDEVVARSSAYRGARAAVAGKKRAPKPAVGNAENEDGLQVAEQDLREGPKGEESPAVAADEQGEASTDVAEGEGGDEGASASQQDVVEERSKEEEEEAPPPLPSRPAQGKTSAQSNDQEEGEEGEKKEVVEKEEEKEEKEEKKEKEEKHEEEQEEKQEEEQEEKHDEKHEEKHEEKEEEKEEQQEEEEEEEAPPLPPRRRQSSPPRLPPLPLTSVSTNAISFPESDASNTEPSTQTPAATHDPSPDAVPTPLDLSITHTWQTLLLTELTHITTLTTLRTTLLRASAEPAHPAHKYHHHLAPLLPLLDTLIAAHVRHLLEPLRLQLRSVAKTDLLLPVFRAWCGKAGGAYQGYCQRWARARAVAAMKGDGGKGFFGGVDELVAGLGAPVRRLEAYCQVLDEVAGLEEQAGDGGVRPTQVEEYRGMLGRLREAGARCVGRGEELEELRDIQGRMESINFHHVEGLGLMDGGRRIARQGSLACRVNGKGTWSQVHCVLLDNFFFWGRVEKPRESWFGKYKYGEKLWVLEAPMPASQIRCDTKGERTKSSMTDHVPRGIELFPFTVTAGDIFHLFAAATEAERDEWMGVLQDLSR